MAVNDRRYGWTRAGGAGRREADGRVPSLRRVRAGGAGRRGRRPLRAGAGRDRGRQGAVPTAGRAGSAGRRGRRPLRRTRAGSAGRRGRRPLRRVRAGGAGRRGRRPYGRVQTEIADGRVPSLRREGPILSLRASAHTGVAIRNPRPPSPFFNVFKWQFENTSILHFSFFIFHFPQAG